MDFSICDVQPQHIAQIEDIEKSCFSAPWTREQLLSQRSGDMHVFLAACGGDGSVLGYAGMACVLDEGYISNVAVAPRYRRQGVADGLLDELLRRSGERELAFVTLEVRRGNISAQGLYAKHGFIPVGERRNYYTLPAEDAVLMTKFLK